MKKLLVLATLAAALATPFAAQAETPKGQRIYISLAGADLSNPAAADAAIRRIEAAVRPMCTEPGVSNGRTVAGCVREVTRDALKNLRIQELETAFQRGSAPTAPVPPSPVSQG